MEQQEPQVDEKSFSSVEEIFDHYRVSYVKGNCHCPYGWLDLIHSLVYNMILISPPETWAVDQVKSKFNSLRFYHNVRQESVIERANLHKLVASAELASECLCVRCGLLEYDNKHTEKTCEELYAKHLQ